MRKSTGFSMVFVFVASLLCAVAAHSSLAQDKKGAPSSAEGTIKEIEQNEKVRVYEVTYKPGEGSPSAKRPMRVIHVIQGGSLERTYEDGKKEVLEWKAGATRILTEERAYSVKNVGKGVVHLLIVAMK
jgi:hypothetical protein